MELLKTGTLRELQDWFASHSKHPTVFDISSLGFYNWLKKHYKIKEGTLKTYKNMKTIGIFCAGQAGDTGTITSVFKYRNELWGDDHKIVWYISKENADILKHQDIEVREFPRGFGYTEMVIEENKKLIEQGKEPIWEDWQPLVDWDNRLNVALKHEFPSLADIDIGYWPAPHQMSSEKRHGLIYPEVSRKVFGLPDTYEWHPVLAFSDEERDRVNKFMYYPYKVKFIGIESYAGSGQSKITDENISKAMGICKEVFPSCEFVFLSHKYLNGTDEFPDHILERDDVRMANHFTVRQCALVVAKCDILVSVSSGITVAASCWENKNNPPKIIQYTGSRICSTELLALGRFELIRTDGRSLEEASEHFYETLKIMLNEIK